MTEMGICAGGEPTISAIELDLLGSWSGGLSCLLRQVVAGVKESGS